MSANRYRCIGPWTIENPSEHDLQLVRTAVQRGICRYVVFCHENNNVQEEEEQETTFCIRGFASAYKQLNMVTWMDTMGPKLSLASYVVSSDNIPACIMYCKGLDVSGTEPRAGVGKVEEFGVYDNRKARTTLCKRKEMEDDAPTTMPTTWQDDLWRMVGSHTSRVTVVVVEKRGPLENWQAMKEFAMDLHEAGTVCLVPPEACCTNKDEIMHHILSMPPSDMYLFIKGKLSGYEVVVTYDDRGLAIGSDTVQSAIPAAVSQLEGGIAYAKGAPPMRLVRQAKMVILTSNLGEKLPRGWQICRLCDTGVMSDEEWRKQEQKRKVGGGMMKKSEMVGSDKEEADG